VNGSDPSGHLTTGDAKSLIDFHEENTDKLPDDFVEVTVDGLIASGLSQAQAEGLFEMLDRTRSSVYQNTKTNEYTIVFDHTETAHDWGQNFLQAAGASTDYSAAIFAARDWSRFATKSGADLSFAGHSKGGGMATAAAMSVGNPKHMEADTIDPASVSAATMRSQHLDSTNSNLDISNIVVKGEAISVARAVGTILAPRQMWGLGILGPAGQTKVIAPRQGTSLNPIVRHGLDVVPSSF
jgi:hypothetical protein